MTQKFVKGRTNNHLSWVMVDATDFATPESALSAATKIKIYGKLRSATGVNFVSSGTGSLTNDIQHVGASALGIYTIALAKADLSDASAAWYDQYVVSLSATGAAYQTLIVDGGIDDSYLSAINSDQYSMLTAQSDAVSNVYSAVLLTQSLASDAASAAAQANSRVLLGNSMISDVDSALSSQFTAISGLVSDTHSAAVVAQSISASDMSDLRSAIAAVTVTISASDISDIASAVAAGIGFTPTAIASKVWSDYESRIGTTASDANSKAVLAQSRLSDVQSYLVAMSGMLSDTHSAAVVAQSISASDMSDLRSAIAGVAATVTASDISDIASAVKASISSELSDILSAAQQTNSRALVAQSYASDAYSAALLTQSMVSDVYSVLTSTRAEPGQGAPGATITALAKLDYLYKAWRNKKEQTATTFSLYDDAGTTVDHKATTSDDATTATVGEIVAGP